MFRKSKEVVLQCFTYNAVAYEAFPIRHASRDRPKWWMELPVDSKQRFFPTPTLKTCPGINQFFKRSIMIDLWSDLAIDVNANRECRWQFADLSTEITMHDVSQRGGFLPGDSNAHMKVISPWIFTCADATEFLWSHPTYHSTDLSSIQILPGIVNYKHQHGTHINMMLPTDRPRSVLLRAGQPMVNITMLGDIKVKIENYLITKEEFLKKESIGNRVSFIN